MQTKLNHHHHNYRFPLLALAILLLLAGAFSYSQLKTGLFPDITFPKIKVIVDAGQQPINKMMVTVTVPLENIIKRTEGLDYIRSTTARGSCEISVFLKWDTNIDNAKLQIESFVSEIQNELPPGIIVTVQKMNPSILPIMGYSLEGNRSQVELRKIAQYQIKPFLAATPGVSDIAIIGGKIKELQVVLRPEKLSELGVTAAQIQTAIVQSNILESNGYISDHNRLYLTLTDNAVDNIQELKSLVLNDNPKRLVHLSDVANVQLSEAKEYIKINANGKDVPLVAVIKQPNANLVDVNNGIEDRVAQLSKILPKDVKLVPYYKQADFVNESIRSIIDVLWIGLVLAIIVVMIFLRSISTSTVVLITIPVTLSLTLTMLYMFGYTFNIMTLGAIAAAIGLVIDDAVIVVEQIHRSHEEHPKEAMSHVVSKAIRYLIPAMVGSSLTTIVIFIPFSLMSGVAGAYFKVLAYTMIITLSASFVVTWIILPMLFLFLPIKKAEQKETKAHHPGWIRYCIHRPTISALFVLVSILILCFIPSRLPSGFLPDMDEGGIVLDFFSQPGTTLVETDRMLKQVDEILKKQPEVEKFSRRLGTQMGFFITEPNRGDYLVQLKQKRNKTTEEVIDEIRKKIEASIPQLRVDYGQVIADMLGDLMSSVQPIEIKVFGDNKTTIENLSRQIAAEVEKVKGTADVYDGVTIAGPEVNMQPDIVKLSQLGMNPTDLQFQLQTQIEGNVVSTMLDKEQRVNIRLIYPDALNTTIHSLENTNVQLPNGMFKPLSTLASIKLEKGVAEINRENQKIVGIITARLNERDLGSTLKDVQQVINTKIKLPDGYHIEYGGSYAQQQQAFKELLLILIAASLLVFIVILFLFRSLGIAFLVIGISILGVAGSILALFLTNTALNVGSYTGIIMVVGIIAENAIFTFLQYREARHTLETEDSIVYAIATRLRPKLMTACGAIVALLPLALGIGSGAQMHQPLAIAVIGGLLVALPLLLIILPTCIKITKVD
jgi:cobalt-zinc-cadmium resistance protein CzcA